MVECINMHPIGQYTRAMMRGSDDYEQTELYGVLVSLEVFSRFLLQQLLVSRTLLIICSCYNSPNQLISYGKYIFNTLSMATSPTSGVGPVGSLQTPTQHPGCQHLLA